MICKLAVNCPFAPGSTILSIRTKIPLLDAFYIIFPVISLIFLIIGVGKQNLKLIFLSGITTGIGLFFSLTIAPFLLFYFVAIILLSKCFRNLVKYYLSLAAGILVLFLFLLLFGINMLTIINAILVNGLVQRAYFPWVIYNFYDFFIFTGIPILIIFIYLIKELIKNFSINKLSKEVILLISCLTTMLTVDILGMNRGETGRIWVIFTPFIILAIAGYLTNQIKINTKLFRLLVFIQLIQVLVMQMFWVMLW